MGEATSNRDGAALELERVCVRYAGARAPALHEVSVSAAPGEIVALLGANGAGKSTLLRAAAGLLVPDEGAVRLLGRDFRTLERRHVARLVAFVSQSEEAAVGFTVRQVVAMGRAPHQEGWMRECPEDRRVVEEALARCDLEGLATRRVETLSGGERRRVALARALAQGPRVLVLDEPAAFLDVRHRLDLHELLADIARRDGLACLVAMHDFDAAAQLAGHVVLLRTGRVLAAGPAERVMTTARLRDAFDTDVEVGTDPSTGARYFVAVRATRTALPLDARAGVQPMGGSLTEPLESSDRAPRRR